MGVRTGRFHITRPDLCDLPVASLHRLANLFSAGRSPTAFKLATLGKSVLLFTTCGCTRVDIQQREIDYGDCSLPYRVIAVRRNGRS
jgi:hypothetical protein